MFGPSKIRGAVSRLRHHPAAPLTYGQTRPSKIADRYLNYILLDIDTNFMPA
jgi:hypothetical protein